jgi:hypothetical protein
MTTNVGNPVQDIASLLMGDAQQPKVETPEVDQDQEETLEVSDESQSQDESLAESEETSEETPDEDILDTINNLAEELDVPIEDMYALNIKLSKGSNLPEGGKITLGELKTFYEKNADIDNLREQLTTREQELQSQAEKVSEVPKVSNELMNARAQVLALEHAYQNIDWNGIRYNNPGEYAALQADFRNRFDSAKQQEAQAGQVFEEHRKQNAEFQRDKLFNAVPELKDEKVRVQIAQDVQAFASKYGFTSKEVGDIEDHRLMRMLIEASRTDKAKVTAQEKKVDKTPTASKPSTSRPIPGRNAALKRLTEKAKASGNSKDKVAAIEALII